jgi:hypothetical protein
MNKSIKHFLVFIVTLGIALTLVPQSAHGRSRMNVNTRVGVVSTIGGTAWYFAIDGYYPITRNIYLGPTFTYTPGGDVKSYSLSLIAYYHKNVGPLYLKPYVGYGYTKSTYKPSGISVDYDAEGKYIPFGLQANFRLGRIGSVNASLFGYYQDIDYGYGIGSDNFNYGASGGVNFYL